MNRKNFPRVRNLVLIGMPGSGKTTFGRVYAFRTRRQFLDFDAFVETTAKKTIQEIWQEEGEQGFRQRERECLLRLQKRHSSIIAMGGGTVCNPQNFRLARSLGLVVFLDVPVDLLVKRLTDNRGTRPMFPPDLSVEELASRLRKLEEVRLPFYDCADAALRPALSSTDCMVLELFGIENRGNVLMEKRRNPEILKASGQQIEQERCDLAQAEGQEPIASDEPPPEMESTAPVAEATSTGYAGTSELDILAIHRPPIPPTGRGKQAPQQQRGRENSSGQGDPGRKRKRKKRPGDRLSTQRPEGRPERPMPERTATTTETGQDNRGRPERQDRRPDRNQDRRRDRNQRPLLTAKPASNAPARSAIPVQRQDEAGENGESGARRREWRNKFRRKRPNRSGPGDGNSGTPPQQP